MAEKQQKFIVKRDKLFYCVSHIFHFINFIHDGTLPVAVVDSTEARTITRRIYLTWRMMAFFISNAICLLKLFISDLRFPLNQNFIEGISREFSDHQSMKWRELNLSPNYSVKKHLTEDLRCVCAERGILQPHDVRQSISLLQFESHIKSQYI